MAKSGIYAFGVTYQTKVVYVYQDKIGHVEKGKISIWIRLSIFRVADRAMNKNIYKFNIGDYAYIDNEYLFIKVMNTLAQFSSNIERELCIENNESIHLN